MFAGLRYACRDHLRGRDWRSDPFCQARRPDASRSQGSITKTGNKHARRILVEAAWNYRHKANVSRPLQVRQQGQPKVIRDISWKAQLRLTQRYRHLRMGRKLHQNKVCIAIARELAGFIWDIGRHIQLAEQ